MAANKSLFDLVIEEYPELEGTRAFVNCVIFLQDDSDGTGAYIREWNYEKPMTEKLKAFYRG